MRCLIDGTAREAWGQESNIKFINAMKVRVAMYNEGLSILEPKGRAMEQFEYVPSVRDIPELGLFSEDEEDQKFLGKRYELIAGISWSDSEEPNVEPTIWVRDLSERDSDNQRMASAHHLNDYQKRFLMEHCSLVETPSLCEGKVYLSIHWSPRHPALGQSFVTLEFVGASFNKADEAKVIQSFKH